MADKNFRVKSGLNLPINSAAILTTDSSGNISAGTVLPVANGGTGQTSANNALNALLPIQNGSTINYSLQSDGSNTSWQKLYNQTIKNNGTTVTPRGILNIVGGTFADDSTNDITTLTIPTNYVSLDGGSTITASSASTKGLIIKATSTQTANLFEIQNSAGSTIGRIGATGDFQVGNVNMGRASVTTDSASKVVLGIRGSSSQTANLTEWQNNAGTVLASINTNGSLVLSNAPLQTTYVQPVFGGSGSLIQMAYDSTTTIRSNGLTNVVPLTVKGIASQTANLQEWQNSSGTLLASISNAGSAWFKIGARVSGNYGGSQALLVQNDQNIIGLTVKANSTQTANLQEWQDSSGTVLSYVTSSGSLRTPFVSDINGNGAFIQMNSNSSVTINTRNTTNVGLVVLAQPSQTANLQEWKNSAGTVLASLSSSGNLMVQDLTVNGTTTTINSTTLTVDDKNIELASVTSPTDTTADGAGITIKGATDKTFNWVQSTAAFTSSEPISAPAFKSAGTAVSSDITLSSGYRYFVDTTSARTLTLPSIPSVGDEIQIFDASNNALTNNITVQSNGNKIQGSVQDLTIDSNAAAVYLTYTGSTYGWAVN